jgi:hypothetical protein
MTSIIKVDQIQNAAGVGGLTIDSNGYVKRPLLPRWKARTGPVTTAGYYGDTYIGSRVMHDPTSNYNASTRKFTIPVSGTYAVFGHALHYSNLNGALYFYVNDIDAIDGSAGTYAEGATIGNSTQALTTYLDLNAGDTVAFYAAGANAWYSNGNDYYTFWGGYLIG